MIEAPMDLKSRIRAVVERESAERGEPYESAAELEDVVEHLHDHVFRNPEQRGPDDFPLLSNLSAAFIYEALPIPDDPDRRRSSTCRPRCDQVGTKAKRRT